MSAPPKKRSPRHSASGASRGSNHGQGEKRPAPSYGTVGEHLNRDEDWVHDDVFCRQLARLGQIARASIKCILVRDAELIPGTSVLTPDMQDAAELVFLLQRGEGKGGEPVNWWFWTYATRDGALGSAQFIGAKNGLAVIDDTTVGRATVPAVLS